MEEGVKKKVTEFFHNNYDIMAYIFSQYEESKQRSYWTQNKREKRSQDNEAKEKELCAR